jgi:hypothetical protein
VNFFRKRKDTYIQKEHEKIFGDKSPFSDRITFHIVKTHYLGEIFKLINEKNKKEK